MLKPLNFLSSENYIWYNVQNKEEIDCGECDLFYFNNSVVFDDNKLSTYGLDLGKKSIGFNKSLDKYTLLGYFINKDEGHPVISAINNNNSLKPSLCKCKRKQYNAFGSNFKTCESRKCNEDFTYHKGVTLLVDTDNKLLIFASFIQKGTICYNYNFHVKIVNGSNLNYYTIRPCFIDIGLDLLRELTGLSEEYFRLYYDNIKTRSFIEGSYPNEALVNYKCYLEGDFNFVTIKEKRKWLENIIGPLKKTKAIRYGLVELLFTESERKLLKLKNGKWRCYI